MRNAAHFGVPVHAPFTHSMHLLFATLSFPHHCHCLSQQLRLVKIDTISIYFESKFASTTGSIHVISTPLLTCTYILYEEPTNRALCYK